MQKFRFFPWINQEVIIRLACVLQKDSLYSTLNNTAPSMAPDEIVAIFP